MRINPSEIKNFPDGPNGSSRGIAVIEWGLQYYNVAAYSKCLEMPVLN